MFPERKRPARMFLNSFSAWKSPTEKGDDGKYRTTRAAIANAKHFILFFSREIPFHARIKENENAYAATPAHA